jgi:hypothetical protein
MNRVQSLNLSGIIERALTLMISGSIAAMHQIKLRTSRGNCGKKVKSSAGVEVEAEVEFKPLPKDKDEREKEDMVMMVCSCLFAEMLLVQDRQC